MYIGSNIVIKDKEVLSRFGKSVEEVQNDLTITNPEYTSYLARGRKHFYRPPVKELCFLKKIGAEFIIPRYYFGEIKHHFSKSEFNWIEGRETKFQFLKKLRDYQIPYMDKIVEEERTGVVMEVPCGHGKTVQALYLASIYARQCLVLVPTYTLAKQWAKRVKEFTDAECFILDSTTKKCPNDVDILIMVLDTFTVRELPTALLANIGVVILDEAHRVGAASYMPILSEVPAKYRIALTATFRRTDGMHHILKYHFGEVYSMSNRFPRPEVYTVETKVKFPYLLSKNKAWEELRDFLEDKEYFYKETPSCLMFKDNIEKAIQGEPTSKDFSKTRKDKVFRQFKRACEVPYTVVDTYLSESGSRNKTLHKVIDLCMEAGRNTLVISKRKKILYDLHKKYSYVEPALIVSETTKRSDEEEEHIETKCPLILGVAQLAKEGLDIDRLDCLIIHLPIKDLEQPIGRISRILEGKKYPVVIYLLDDAPITWAVFNNAKKFIKINAEYKGHLNWTQLQKVLNR